MEILEIIQIGKKVILLAAKYKKVSPENSIKVSLELSNYKKQLIGDTSSYSHKILGFIDDLLNDIASGKEFQIDIIKNDDYIENLIISHTQREKYNHLIEPSKYQEIMIYLQKDKISKKQVQFLFEDIENNFNTLYGELSSEYIAKYFLIFCSKNISKPQNACKYLFHSLHQKNILNYDERIKKMYQKISLFKKDIKIKAQNHLKNKSFEYKYMDFNYENNFISNELIDTSLLGGKSGNSRLEYRKLVQQL